MDDYAQQAKAAWGKTDAYKEFEQRDKQYTKADRDRQGEEIMALMARFGEEAPVPKKGVYVGWMFPEQRDAALALAAKLRAQGECVNLALRKAKPKQFFSRAGASSCAKAVFLGPDDVAAGQAKIKDLATREETAIAL